LKEFKIEIGKDGSSLSIKAGDMQRMKLKADELDALIYVLAQARTALKPPMQLQSIEHEQRILAAPEMRWWLGKRDDQPVPLLALLHPGVGWVAIGLEADSLEMLRAECERQLSLLAGYKAPTVQ